MNIAEKFYYVAFGNETQQFVIATFKGDENGARTLCDTINAAIRKNPTVARAYCNVFMYLPPIMADYTLKNIKA